LALHCTFLVTDFHKFHEKCLYSLKNGINDDIITSVSVIIQYYGRSSREHNERMRSSTIHQKLTQKRRYTENFLKNGKILLHNAHKQTIIPDIGKDNAGKKKKLAQVNPLQVVQLKDIYGSHTAISWLELKQFCRCTPFC
jgi:hypothetical protein